RRLRPRPHQQRDARLPRDRDLEGGGDAVRIRGGGALSLRLRAQTLSRTGRGWVAPLRPARGCAATAPALPVRRGAGAGEFNLSPNDVILRPAAAMRCLHNTRQAEGSIAAAARYSAARLLVSATVREGGLRAVVA